ncbi:AMP-binding protein [Streptomyces specialis]|uniref:AMP-binding protein n=1 Tax=Streptomyces specialis TaxID=498367 RepID=UPI00099EB87E|nr:AMP-binding protein [Streptomyces specialis]
MSEQRGRGSESGAPADVLSHAQLLRQSDRAAEVLSGLGVGAGDTVPVLLPMSLESVVVTLACLRLSATRLTLPLGSHHAVIRDRVNDSRATVVLTADACRLDGQVHAVKSGLDRALAGCPAVRDVLVIGQLPRPVPWVPGRDRWWHETLGPPLSPDRPYPGTMSDTARPGPSTPDPLARLVFDDPLERGSADDADHGWGESPAEGSGAGDLARFLSEKPPHHL